ncbi:MAG: RidA family protein [Ectothiorhodospiraceae bacterium AqS1]|nr:RidA family protein [Ectothiorhodospiraceae bacterium AqS1]
MPRTAIVTSDAPGAIGAYSQAIRAGDTVYLSGQIPLHPESMKVVSDDPKEQIHQVLRNLSAVAEAAGGSLDDVVKLNVYLKDLSIFPLVNEVMAEYFTAPYPARAAIGVASLPLDVEVEIEGILVKGL